MNVARRNRFARGVAGLFALAVGWGLLPGPAAGRQAKEAEPKSPAPAAAKANDLEIVPLKHAAVSGVLEILNTLVSSDPRLASCRFVADERTNAVLVYAPAAEAARVKEMIAKLDVPVADSGPPPNKLTVFPLRHVEPDKSLEQSLRLLLGQGHNFSIDPQRKSVIVYADPKTTENVEALLARLEDVQAPAHKPEARKPTGDVQVRVVWLVNGPSPKNEGQPPPEDLKEVLPGLARMGIDRPKLAAQALVNVTPDAEFQAKGVVQLGSHPCQFILMGQYGGLPEAPGLSITITAASQGEHGPPVEIVNLRTSITAPPGHLVVLGMTPTETLTSVFVVQVLRPEGKKP
jgi:Bacterial type II/III secretion system short domain